MVIDDLKITLNLHIFDRPGLSFHLTSIGRPIMGILEGVLGNEKLSHSIGEEYLPIGSSQSLNTGVESKPVLDPRGELMLISLITMTHPNLEEAWNVMRKKVLAHSLRQKVSPMSMEVIP